MYKCYLRRTAKVMFSPLLVSLSIVCLYVCNITGKRKHGFSWNFQDRSDKIQEAIWTILRVLRLTPWIPGLFFPRTFVSVSSITDNGWTEFYVIFGIQNQCFSFLDPCFFVFFCLFVFCCLLNIMETGEWFLTKLNGLSGATPEIIN